MNTNLTFTSHSLSHVGNIRKRNEDSLLDLSSENLWVVADGMGGHNAGDFASQCIVSHFSTFKKQSSLAKSVDLIEKLVFDANADIQTHASETKVDKTQASGSTIVGLFTWDDIGIVFWSGDSRLYRYNSHLERLSEDHSYVEQLIQMGRISAADAEAHPSANIILNAVGIKEKLYLDLDSFKIEENDIFILCSDGLYKDLSEQNLSDLIEKNKNSVEQVSNQLLEAALEAGGSDNISIITIDAVTLGKD